MTELNLHAPLVVATGNPGKLTEIRAILADFPIQLLSLANFPNAPSVVEDCETLEGNARKKARIIRDFTGHTALADDTGLEVDALDGAPGVYSARFAGPNADDASNRQLLLSRLEGQSNRAARFRTVIALATPNGMHTFEGICEGTILSVERGMGGFGYDSLFLPSGTSDSFAEMEAVRKNAISHRARALAAFATWIREEAHT